MDINNCPCCGGNRTAVAPDEPPVGTWVKDRNDRAFVRVKDAYGGTGWSASPTAMYGSGRWEAMWEAWGPLTVCGPWGTELHADA